MKNRKRISSSIIIFLKKKNKRTIKNKINISELNQFTLKDEIKNRKQTFILKNMLLPI